MPCFPGGLMLSQGSREPLPTNCFSLESLSLSCLEVLIRSFDEVFARFETGPLSAREFRELISAAGFELLELFLEFSVGVSFPLALAPGTPAEFVSMLILETEFLDAECLDPDELLDLGVALDLDPPDAEEEDALLWLYSRLASSSDDAFPLVRSDWYNCMRVPCNAVKSDSNSPVTSAHTKVFQVSKDDEYESLGLRKKLMKQSM